MRKHKTNEKVSSMSNECDEHESSHELSLAINVLKDLNEIFSKTTKELHLQSVYETKISLTKIDSSKRKETFSLLLPHFPSNFFAFHNQGNFIDIDFYQRRSRKMFSVFSIPLPLFVHSLPTLSFISSGARTNQYKRRLNFFHLIQHIQAHQILISRSTSALT